MTDVEARLRRTLGEKLDGVTADPRGAAPAIRRARRGRVVRGISTGLAGLLVAGAAAVALERRGPDRRPRPAAAPKAVETFALRFESGDGTLTIDVPKAQACIDLSRHVSGSRAELRYDAPGPDDPLVADLPAGAPGCQPLDPSAAERVLADPGRHYVSLGQFGLSGASALRPFDVAPVFLPDVAKVVCSQDGAVALTPLVQPRENGVHLRIYNENGAWDEFNVTSPAGGNAGGALPRRGALENAWNLPPGPHSIGCFRETRPIPYNEPRHPDYARFKIVDPHDLWIEPGLDCLENRRRREVVSAVPVRSYRREPAMEPLIRELVPGVTGDDSFIRVTYPESPAKSEHLTLVRAGRKIAVFYLTSEEDPDAPGEYVWSLLPYVCPGNEIGTRRR